jgi:hypothetical protein
LLRIVKKLSSKKLDVSRYIELINKTLKGILIKIKELDKLPNVGINQSIYRECVDTLEFFMRNIISITKEDVILLITHKAILNELKEILIVDNQFPNNHKRKVIDLLCCVFEDFEKSIEIEKKEKVFIIGEDGEEIELPDDAFDGIDGDAIDYKERINENHKLFLEMVNTTFIPLIKTLISNYFDNRNNINKHKINNEFMGHCCDVLSKISALVIKYLGTSKLYHIDFIIGSSSFFSNRTAKFLISSRNNETVELLTLIPFKCLNILLNIYPDIILTFLNNNINELKRFIEYFIYALFSRRRSLVFRSQYNKSNLSDNDAYILNLYNSIGRAEDMLLSQIDMKKKENINLSTKLIEDMSILNMLLFIFRNNDMLRGIISNFTTFYLFTNDLIDKLVSNKHLDKIDIKAFLGFVEKNRLEEIIFRSKALSDNYEDYNCLIFEFFYKLINKFSETVFCEKNSNEILASYINSQLKLTPSLILNTDIVTKDLTFFHYLIKSTANIEKYKPFLYELINKLINRIQSQVKNYILNNAFEKNINKIYIPKEIYFNENSTDFLIELFEYIVNHLYEFTSFNEQCFFYFMFVLMTRIFENGGDNFKIITEKLLNLAYCIRIEKFEIINSLSFYAANLVIKKLVIFLQIFTNLISVAVNNEIYNETYLNNFNNLLLYLVKANSLYIFRIYKDFYKYANTLLEKKIQQVSNQNRFSCYENEIIKPLNHSIKEQSQFFLIDCIKNNLIILKYFNETNCDEEMLSIYTRLNLDLLKHKITETQQTATELLKKEIISKEEFNNFPYTLRMLKI